MMVSASNTPTYIPYDQERSTVILDNIYSFCDSALSGVKFSRLIKMNTN